MTDQPTPQPIEILLVEDDPGDVLMTREAFEDYKIANRLTVVSNGEDAIAYLRAIANRSDDVSVRRILNVPKRGIGDRAEGAVEELATRLRISFGDALRRLDEVHGLATRSAKQLQVFVDLMDKHEAMVAEAYDALRANADYVLRHVATEGPTAGLVTWEHRAINQRGETVCTMKRTALIRKAVAL